MTHNYSNVAVQTALSSGVNDSATSIQVSSTTGFPSPDFVLALDADAATQELVLVTGVAGTTLTVERGYDNTTAVAHDVGAVVRHSHCAKDFEDSRDHEVATAAHGATGAVVGTTNTQALANKDLSSGTNIFPSTLATDAEVAAVAATAAADLATHAADTATHGVATVAGLTEAQTLTNKTVALGSNTVSGTTAQFNAANTDGDFATLAGTETLTNKTLASPTITGVGEVRYVNKAVSETVINSAVMQADDELKFSVEENATYVVEAVIIWEGSVASGITTLWTAPAGATFDGVSYIHDEDGTNGAIRAFAWTGTAPSYDVGGQGIGTPLALRESFQLRVAGTAGQATFNWTQAIAHATNTRVKSGSYLVIRRVA